MSLLPVGIGSSGGYTISRSVRTRSSASAYLNRTPSVSGSASLWTWSGWVKRGSLGSNVALFSAAASASAGTSFRFINDTLDVYRYNGTAYNWRLVTTQLFRDPSAWYHIIIAFDSGQATASDRVKIYVNGTQVTAFSTASYPTTSYVEVNGSGYVHYVSRGYAASEYFDGYQTEINFIDGQALTPSSFGETNPATGVWQPKKYAGTYGTNGFYLNFSDNSAATATTIGKDYSGNGNNWTPNNISVTAGVTYDSMLDVPTLWADGGNGRGNYAVLNPLLTGGTGTPSNGNLTSSATDATNQSSFPMQTGKWYAEVTLTTLGSQDVTVGITFNIGNVSGVPNSGGYGWGVRLGRKWINGSATTGFSTAVNGDIAGLAFDADSGQLDVYKNNVLVFSITGISTGIAYNFVNGAGGTSGANTINYNFGQRPFAYTPPTGFVALNTQNLPDATIKKGNQYFDILTWSGDSTNNRSITGLNFSPDFAWVKSRSYAGQSHHFVDNVRGVGTGIMRTLYSNQTVAEETTTSAATLTFGGIKSLDANGITTVAGTNGANPYAQTNQSPQTYVGWHWNAGGSTVTNTSGTISSQVRANPSAGFSIVTYTGTGANATVGHGLGVAPKMIIVKRRDVADIWCTYTSITGAGNYLNLQSTAASTANTAVWNNTTPTSTVFSVAGSAATNNTSGTYVAYCFAEVAGYSAFGKYTGNGSADGPFVYLGFRPRFVLIKESSSTGSWYMYDTARDAYNVMDTILEANYANAETTASTLNFDIVSNGFKIRGTNGDLNTSTSTYIYAAFAENPFKHSLAR